MKKVLAVMIALLLLAVSGCAKKNAPENDAASADTGTFTIETETCVLKYPKKWEGTVSTTVDNEKGIVSFKTGDTPLFDILFDGEAGDLLGTLQVNGRNVVLRLKTYEIDPEGEQYAQQLEMQEDINVLLNYLNTDYSFAAGMEVPQEDLPVFEIKTDTVTLYYPEKWKDQVRTEVTDQGVSFASGDTRLFDITFAETENSVLLGYYGRLPIYMVAYDLDQSSLSPEDFSRLRVMQEDVNVILQHLMTDAAFTAAES